MSIDRDLFNRQIWGAQSRFELLLRGHLWVEHFMEKMLILVFKRPESVALDRLTWTHKLGLCDGLDLVTPWEATALSEMNRIRNRLAHNLTSEPSDNDIAGLLKLSPPNVLAAVDAVREVEKKGDRLGEDESLSDLRFWLLVLAMDLDYRVETQEYERTHETNLWRAMGLKVSLDMTGKPITQEEAEKREGLPPRPQPGASFRPPRD